VADLSRSISPSFFPIGKIKFDIIFMILGVLFIPLGSYV
jgi:hypothetical protein